MKNTKRLLSLVLTFCMVMGLLTSMPISVSAEAFPDTLSGLTFEIITEPDPGTGANGTVKVIAGAYTGTEYTIPATVDYTPVDVINTYDVVSIGESAFANCSSLTSVTIPSSVTSIGDNAFKGCSAISFLSIPGQVVTIGSSAFEGCTALGVHISIVGSQLTSIGNLAFKDCTELEYLSVPKDVTIADDAFTNCNVVVTQEIDETPEGYTSNTTVYGNYTIEARSEFPGEGDRLILDPGANITVNGTISFPTSTLVEDVTAQLTGDGIIRMAQPDNSVGAQPGDIIVTAAYKMTETGVTAFANSNGTIDVAGGDLTGNGVAVDTGMKTITISGDTYIPAIRVNDGYTVINNGTATVPVIAPSDGLGGRITLSGTGELKVRNVNWRGGSADATVAVAEGTVINSNNVSTEIFSVAGTANVEVENDGGLNNVKVIERTGNGVINLVAFGRSALNLSISDTDFAAYQSNPASETALIENYIKLNGGVESNGYVAKIKAAEGGSSGYITFVDQNGAEVSQINLVPAPSAPTPTPTPQPSSSGGGSAKLYKLTYKSNIEDVKDVIKKYSRKKEVTLADVSIFNNLPEGMELEGWAEVPEGEVVYKGGEKLEMPAKDIELYAVWNGTTEPDKGDEGEAVTPGLNKEDHISYIMGYPDKEVKPLNNITRAETAMVYYRLLDEETRAFYSTTEHPFEDIPSGHWAAEAIATLYKAGIATGRTDTEFVPDEPITRAEYAAFAAKFDSDPFDPDLNQFKDVEGHEAEEWIYRAAARGWIVGDGDGYFRPDEFITRAEAATLINRVLERNPESAEDLLDGMLTFTDNKAADWWYLDIQEAANSHEYVRKENGREKWTALNNQ